MHGQLRSLFAGTAPQVLGQFRELPNARVALRARSRFRLVGAALASLHRCIDGPHQCGR